VLDEGHPLRFLDFKYATVSSFLTKVEVSRHRRRSVVAPRYEGKNYEVLRKSLRAYRPRDVCEPGQVLMSKKCGQCQIYFTILLFLFVFGLQTIIKA